MFPLLTQDRVFRVAASRAARPLWDSVEAASVLSLDFAPAPVMACEGICFVAGFEVHMCNFRPKV